MIQTVCGNWCATDTLAVDLLPEHGPVLMYQNVLVLQRPILDLENLMREYQYL